MRNIDISFCFKTVIVYQHCNARVSNLFSFLCCVLCFVRLLHMFCAPNVASVSVLSILDCLLSFVY